MAASKAPLRDFWMYRCRNFYPRMEFWPCYLNSLSKWLVVGFTSYLDISFPQTHFCKRTGLRILYFWAYTSMLVVSGRQPKYLKWYLMLVKFAFVRSFRIEWNIFWFVHEMLADYICLRIVVLSDWFVLLEGSFIARTEDIRIIMTLYYFGRMKFWLFWYLEWFVCGLMSSFGLEFEMRLHVVVAGGALAIVFHRFL